MIYDKLKTLKRKRINTILQKVFDYKLTFIYASGGYGKTTAVRNFISEQVDVKTLQFALSDHSNSVVLDRFYCCIENFFDFKIKQDGDVEDIIEKIKKAKKSDVLIIIDDFRHDKSERLTYFISRLTKADIVGIRIIVISREKPQVEQRLDSNCLILNQDIFAFNKEEINELFSANNILLTEKEVDTIHNYSEGWSAVVYLLLMEYVRNDDLSSAANSQTLIKKLVFDELSNEDQILLLKLSVLDEFTIEQAEFVTENKDVAKLIKNLWQNRCFIHYIKVEDKYKLHQILKDALQEEMNEYYIQKDELYALSAEWFLNNCDSVSAIELYFILGKYDKIYETMENVYSVEFLNIIPEIIGKVFMNMDDETKLKYPIAYITYVYSYLFYVNLPKGALFLNAAKLFYEKNLPDSTFIVAEIMLLESFIHYNDITVLYDLIFKAFTLFDGRKSRIINERMNFNFGVPCVLYLYHNKKGQMRKLLENLQRLFPIFQRISNGCGSGLEHIALGEYAMEIGDYALAEKEANKALYKAEYANQNSVESEARGIMIRLALIKGNYNKAKTLLMDMENMILKCTTLSTISQIEMSMGYAWGIIGDIDKMPLWLSDYDFTKSKSFFQGAQACFIMFGVAMILKGDFDRLEAHSEIMEEAFDENKNIFRLIYSLIFNAISKYHFQEYQISKELLLKALEIARPDKILLPFIELSPHYIEILKSVSKTDEFASTLLKECVRYTNNYNAYHNITIKTKYNLSKREKEVMEMLRSGNKQKDIAEQLSISIPTVKTHVKNIYNKLGVDNKKDAIYTWNNTNI